VLMCECGLVLVDWRALRSVKNSQLFDVAGREGTRAGWLAGLKAERSLRASLLSSSLHSFYSHVPSHIQVMLSPGRKTTVVLSTDISCITWRPTHCYGIVGHHSLSARHATRRTESHP